MAKEIERKFLLSDKSILETSTDRHQIIQGYLSSNPDSTVRIRIIDRRAFLTVKSRNVGAMRNEWEYEISVEDAESMIEACGIVGLISKTRHRIDLSDNRNLRSISFAIYLYFSYKNS